jgi:hypothetical protein
MAQTLTSKITKLAEIYSITAIIDTAKQVQKEQADIAVWDAMSTDEKTEWFLNQCSKYNLTTEEIGHQIKVIELPEIGKHGGTRAYFTAFMPREQDPEFHIEIGSAYASSKHGTIWPTARGLKGKEFQIQQVIRLHKEGK